MGNERRTEVKDGVLIVGDAPGGNYRAEMIRQGLKLPPGGGLRHVNIYHDDWCGIWSRHKCNCNPSIKVRPQPVAIDGAGETEA